MREKLYMLLSRADPFRYPVAFVVCVILSAIIWLCSGCAMLRSSSPTITSNQPHRMPEIHGYINNANDWLGGGYKLRHNMSVHFVVGVRHGRDYAYKHPTSGWVSGGRKMVAGRHEVLLVTMPSGQVTTSRARCTGSWEMGRALLYDAGVKSGNEQARILRAKGFER